MYSCDATIAQLVGRKCAVFVYRLGATGSNPVKQIFFFFLLFLLRMNSGWVYHFPKLRRSFLAIFSARGPMFEIIVWKFIPDK